MEKIITATIGGMIIGLSASLLLLFNGKVAGVSGMIKSTLSRYKNDFEAPLFLGGLLTGGLIYKSLYEVNISATIEQSTTVILTSGLLVGFGTAMGSGCTSGHGVCGISRLSTRSIVATLTFMLTGALSVMLSK